jgi:hypothetical protein
MSAWAIGLITLASVYGGALLGLALQRVLPEHHLHDSSKDVVKLVIGLLATLSALVLGLLIASAKGAFDAVNDGFKQSAAIVIVIDQALARYGPETKDIRALMRAEFAARLERLFPQSRTEGDGRAALRQPSSVEEIRNRVDGLAPATDAQRAVKSRVQTLISEVSEARWLSYEQASSSTPTAFLVVLASWLAAMFAGFGLFAPRNGTALVALAIGAMAVSTAIFLIEEMSRPLDGVIAISGVPLRDALKVLDK